MKKTHKIAIYLIGLFIIMDAKAAEQKTQKHNSNDLAVTLNNPLANIYMVPFQFNYDKNVGYDQTGEMLTLKLQPVIPVQLSESMNMLSRTIAPIVFQEDVVRPDSKQQGLGDITQSFYFSPTKKLFNKILYGAGPIFSLPTATNSSMGYEQFGAGLTGLLVYQEKGYTLGLMVNQVWKVSGWNDGSDLNQLFLQPFFAKTIKTFTFRLNSEYTYDWNVREATFPINVMLCNLFMIGGKLPMELQLGYRYYVESSDRADGSGGPDWGLRLSFNFVL